MRNRRIALAGFVALLAIVSLRHPSADIRIMTHEAGDRAPQQVSAAVDIGVMAVSLLVTWTAKRFI
ncbi:MAG: hypothetical protein B7Y43_10540 [Sphingomonas sp. 28-62-20]|uniref:hypothetical protein n=1 Tax=unclassified Sphingomonas TaxID=196159 RepID=UPI000A0A6594|nr:hypothetical protein [Sphingomonas sp.]OQW71071.1 MAG: hypothetical protein BVN33_16550 [Proteobacteria bacterium ST_bin13]OYY77317.1 MAG: hypothetical protein B7Y43_10540 [Sphingomonas sp. 28-62-20]